jgi:hypothetical protein
MQDRHFSGDDYKYPDGSLVPPSHYKQLQQREHTQAMPLVRDDVTYQVETRESRSLMIYMYREREGGGGGRERERETK